MDAAVANQALDRLYQRCPHLPRPAGLAGTVLSACNDADPTDPQAAMIAVVAATWPIAATAGAARAHTVAASRLRDQVAAALADPIPGPDGRWVMWAALRAADTLPAGPDTTMVADLAPRLHEYVAASARLDNALAVGLEGGWLAGHRDATLRLVEGFVADIVDLVGAEKLITTFLVPSLPAYAWLDQIADAVYEAAFADEEHPPVAPNAAANPAPAVARAFVPLRQVDPRTRPNTGHRPHTGPGRRPRPTR